jgi:hypothetical protein
MPATEAGPLGSSETVEDVLTEGDIRLLAALGFMAARSGQLVPCIRIFEGLAVLRPSKAFPFIGMAVGYLAVGMASTAIDILRRRHVQDITADPEIQLYLALALYQDGQSAAALDMIEIWRHSKGESTADFQLGKRLSELLATGKGSGRLPVPALVVDPD